LVTAEKREAVNFIKTEHEMSERWACETVEISRTVYRYEPLPKRDFEIGSELQKLAGDHPEMGFGKFFGMLRRMGKPWNHKRVHRVYCSLKLNKRRKHKRRLPARNPRPLAVPNTANECWSADFMSDSLWNGRRFRTFNIVDDFNREALEIEVDLSLPSKRVIRALDRIAEWRGLPRRLRFDNGPEFTGIAVADWAEQNGVELEFIEPGRPMQNGFIERFNRTYREAVLDMYVFESLEQVRNETEKWLEIYNHKRPHDSLGGMPPSEYLQKHNPDLLHL
jgi:putative transposase